MTIARRERLAAAGSRRIAVTLISRMRQRLAASGSFAERAAFGNHEPHGIFRHRQGLRCVLAIS